MPTFEQLEGLALRARRFALTMIHSAGSGHPGGALSSMDLLVYLYFQQMRYQADNPQWPQRDRFVLSKGHACPALYAVAQLAGLIPRAELASFRKLNGSLQGHTHVGTCPWTETSTGSLGQGFSAALGMALGLRHQKIDAATYVMLGDGEMQEGEVWEGAMFAAHNKLNRVCAILDYNKMQSDDTNENIMGLEPLAQKWSAFGWHVYEINGHDFGEMHDAFEAFNRKPSEPTMIIAHTLKGKGVSYMEGIPTWHGSVKLSDDDLKTALTDLGLCDTECEPYLNGSIWQVTS